MTKLDDAETVQESLRLIEDLKFFLATAPANWHENQVIRRYYLNHDEGFVSCVFWNNLYFITGTDIVRCIVYKFEHFGRKIIDRKKFEEGIFSDLRNLKCGPDAILEPPRSDFLEFLFKNSCLRTQKKQKVFFWFNVPHDKLMADALERDLKKESSNQNPTTIASTEPAKSFKYDESANLYTQLLDHIEQQKKIADEAAPAPPPPPPTTTSQPDPIDVEVKKPEDEYDFLNQDTPAQYTQDYEDDFPLDYFDHNGAGAVPEEYISLDPNYHPSAYALLIDDEYNFDPSIFIQPHSSNTPNQVAYNDEYLIEQTQPLKTPLPPPLLATTLQPKSMMYGPMSSSEDFFPIQPPLSAKYQSSFPRGTPIQAHYPPQQFYDPSMHMVRHEPEYWMQPQYPVEPMRQVNQPYVIMDPEGVYQPAQQQMYPVPIASTRQHQISANMMKKKRQMMQNKGIVKPVHHPTKTFGSLDDIVASKTTKVVSSNETIPKDSAPPSSTTEAEGMMQTPPTSASHDNT